MPLRTAPSVSTARFFVLRTPSLPWEVQGAWAQKLPDEAGTPATPDPGSRLPQLEQAVRQPEIREALFLASPDLEAMLDPWLRNELTPERSQRVTLSLVRYLTRMSSRATPFGLFAGCSLGTWGQTNHLVVPDWQHCRRRTRLDMDYVGALVQSLEREPSVRATRRYRPNSGLYQTAGRWRYAEARIEAGRGLDYHLVALEPTPYLDATLALAAGGATLADLAGALAQDAEVELGEAGQYLEQLVDHQVLVSDLPPALTGEEQLPSLRDRLQTHGAAPILGEVQAALLALDVEGFGHPPERYRALARSLEALPAKLELKHLFQVDLYKPAPDLTLAPAVRKALEQGVALLRRLSPPRPPSDLDRFKEAFQTRYESRWVPLLEALDAEAGVGFGPALAPGQRGAPLLEGLAFPLTAPPPARTFTPRDSFLMKKLQALGEAQAWVLDDEDLKALENPTPAPWPDAFVAVASLAAPSPEALAQNAFTLGLEGFSGPSGARLLGRFCQGDPELEAEVRAHLAAEEACRPWAVFAEVVHQPNGRAGNILARPILRTFEIPLLGVSGATDSHQIPPQDLEVGVVGNRIVLRAPRLGREVIPRLTSAHNYTEGLPVYRFLCQLQDQDGGGGAWNWGCLNALPFLPRVCRGKQVLCRARWRVEAGDLPADPDGAAFQALRIARRLPRFVVLEEGDHALWVDLDQPLRVETLLQLVAHRASFTLREAFPGPGELVAAGPDGLFCHELVVPFQRLDSQRTAPEPGLFQAEPSCERAFPPGSEWLYLKLYTGEATADRMLLETIQPFLETHRELWDRWFFLRYADPAPHLRLRFQGRPEVLAGTLLPRLHQALQPLLAAGLCWKLQVDTYERELERYGGPVGMALAEQWFCIDSERTLALLPQLIGDDGAEQRWRCALQGVDTLLTDLGFDLPAKARVVGRAQESLGREFQAQGTLTVQLGHRFRRVRKDLEALLGGTGGLALAQELASRQRACLAELQRADQEGSLRVSLEELASSYAHLQVNRLVRSSPRAEEMVIMTFLGRLYAAQAARPSVRPPGSGAGDDPRYPELPGNWEPHPHGGGSTG